MLTETEVFDAKLPEILFVSANSKFCCNLWGKRFSSCFFLWSDFLPPRTWRITRMTRWYPWHWTSWTNTTTPRQMCSKWQTGRRWEMLSFLCFLWTKTPTKTAFSAFTTAGDHSERFLLFVAGADSSGIMQSSQRGDAQCRHPRQIQQNENHPGTSRRNLPHICCVCWVCVGHMAQRALTTPGVLTALPPTKHPSSF